MKWHRKLRMKLPKSLRRWSPEIGESHAQRDARHLIERIAREHTLNGKVIGTKFEDMVDNCLEILSDQLYQKSTHFLLELIQNADDNTYNDPTPTLSFSYEPGYLRIDCNEVGFTAENVAAICGISKSTKSDKTHDGEFIGEKGIGFKSVFKAADVVWISSCEFMFKFDRTYPLGVVTPIWEEFPKTTRPGWTSIYLKLSSDYDERTLVRELETFDTSLLIFLRRIKEINIEIFDEYTDDDEDSVLSLTLEKRVCKTQYEQESDQIVELQAGAETLKYLVRSHVIEDLPRELKRPNWSQTEIVLAFPMLGPEEEPQLNPQNVYAFLPIRSYNFKFLIQGDFLLTASREDIESTSRWNKTIRDALADAFVKSVRHFSKGPLKYVWPYYLPYMQIGLYSFFKPAVTSILERLRKRSVLESCAGTMHRPDSLVHVPLDQFADKDGLPFTLYSKTQPRYLSSKYPAWVIEATESVGVSKLSPRQFLEDLSQLIAHDPEAFQTKPAEWHSQLAKTLVQLSTDTKLMSLIRGMCLIPLQDGSWTVAKGKSLFFSKGETSLEIPIGICVLTVHPNAESDSNRRILFTSLGVKCWEAPAICRLIVEEHGSSDFDPKALTASHLISHAVFLYQASWQPQKSTDLWFATMQGDRCRGRDLYILGSMAADSSAARIFAQLRTRFGVIHSDYLNAMEPKPDWPDWPDWLVSNLGLSRIPRLITPYVEPKPQPSEALETPQKGWNDSFWGYSKKEKKKEKKKGKKKVSYSEEPPPEEWPEEEPPRQAKFNRHGSEVPVKASSSIPISNRDTRFALSEEFTFMLRECDSPDILELLRDNWHHYSQWIDGPHMKWQSPSFVDASAELKNRIRASLVRSTKGTLLLQETVLPKLDSQLDAELMIPAVEIQEPQRTEWNFLDYFGVLLKADIHYYLRCLISISENAHPDLNTVAHIYHEIQARYEENKELIRAAFHERNIIFVHLRPQGPAVWTNMEDCLAKGINIGAQYHNCSYLFRCLLSPSGDPISGKVHIMTLICKLSKLDDISRSFREVSKLLKDVGTSKAALLLRPLRNKAIFPTINGSGKDGFDTLLDMDDQSWFIADGAPIREAFQGRIPLLALPIQDLPALEDLFRALRLEGRMLSKLTTSQTVEKGQSKINWPYTNSLRSKSPFINALMPHSLQNEVMIKHQIAQMCVRIATNISQVFTVTLDGNEISGAPIPVQVKGSSIDSTLTLTMTEECAAAECPSHELVSLVADTCGIKDLKHLPLLCMALSKSSIESIHLAFVRQGIQVEGLAIDEPKIIDHAKRSDMLQMPSPFSQRLIVGGPSGCLPEAIVYIRGSAHQSQVEDAYDQPPDRRLPVVYGTQQGESVLGNVLPSPLIPANRDPDERDDRVQYLAEVMVSKLLEMYLGQAYSPERDWTSDLRRRFGHASFAGAKSCAPFTLRNPAVIGRMTDFVVEYGHSKTLHWQDRLRRGQPVYHLDLAVSAGNKRSSFAMTTTQLERMRHFRMHPSAYERTTDVVILIRVSDVYSEDLLSIDLTVDPWHLLDANLLAFKKDSVITASLGEDIVAYANQECRFSTPFLPWASSTTTGVLQRGFRILHSLGGRDLYRYNALMPGDIRLLYLLPGEAGDRLQAVITHVPYHSAGTYSALSYVWGTDQRTQELITPDGVLPITLSLSRALRGLRPKNYAITVWADAVCINQDDSMEKVSQIRLLAQIFQSSASTYAFLGGGDETDPAMEMLMQVRCKSALDEGLEGATWPVDLPEVPASWRGRCIPPLHDASWASVEAMFSLPYFRRAWVIQEIVTAPSVKVMCGKWLVDWNDLRRAIQIVEREAQISEQDFSQPKLSWKPFQCLAAQREWEARNHRFSLIMLLEHFRYAESTLSRDRLFALLGLATDGNEAEFEPDYDRPLREVVLRFARAFVRQERGMQMLYRAGLNSQSDRFPSWVPDWTAKRPAGLYNTSGTGITFSASGPDTASIELGAEMDELSVGGYDIDAIANVSTASNVEQDWEKYFSEVDEMIDSAVWSPVQEERADLKWKVPVAGALFSRAAGSGAINMKSYVAFRSYIKGRKNGEGVEERNAGVRHATNHSSSDMVSYITSLQGILEGWRFVVTRRGYVGVVPNMARVGDIVAILRGGSVPFILQRSMTRVGAVRLVGECYIHGIMDGDGLWLPGVTEKKFRLH